MRHVIVVVFFPTAVLHASLANKDIVPSSEKVRAFFPSETLRETEKRRGWNFMHDIVETVQKCICMGA